MGVYSMDATVAVNTHSSTDAELILVLADARSCDSREFHEAWRKVVERHERRVFSVARHVAGSSDAEEIVQETFLSFFRAVRKKALPRHSIAGWLATVAARKAIHIANKRRHERREILRMQQNIDSGRDSAADENTQMDEARRVVADLVGSLPEKLRIPATLYFTANLPQTEIAKELECSQITVSTRINAALDFLRTGLRKAGYTAMPASWTALLTIHWTNSDAMLLARCRSKLLKLPSRTAKSLRHRRMKSAPNHTAFVIAACALIAGAGCLALQMPNPSATSKPLLTQAPLAPRQSSAQPLQARVTAPAVAPVPIAPALIYEDTFDGATLDPFWSKSIPSQEPGFLIWTIDRTRGLGLVAGGIGVTDAESGSKLHSKVELISKLIELDQRPIEIDIDLIGLSSAGPCTIGMDIVDDAGNSITADPVREQTQPGIQLLRLHPSGNTPPVNHFIVDCTGRFARVESDGGISFLNPIPRTAKIKSLALHIAVIAIGDLNTVKWYSKHMRVIRLSRWPNQ